MNLNQDNNDEPALLPDGNPNANEDFAVAGQEANGDANANQASLPRTLLDLYDGGFPGMLAARKEGDTMVPPERLLDMYNYTTADVLALPTVRGITNKGVFGAAFFSLHVLGGNTKTMLMLNAALRGNTDLTRLFIHDNYVLGTVLEYFLINRLRVPLDYAVAFHVRVLQVIENLASGDLATVNFAAACRDERGLETVMLPTVRLELMIGKRVVCFPRAVDIAVPIKNVLLNIRSQRQADEDEKTIMCPSNEIMNACNCTQDMFAVLPEAKFGTVESAFAAAFFCLDKLLLVGPKSMEKLSSDIENNIISIGAVLGAVLEYFLINRMKLSVDYAVSMQIQVVDAIDSIAKGSARVSETQMPAALRDILIGESRSE